MPENFESSLVSEFTQNWIDDLQAKIKAKGLNPNMVRYVCEDCDQNSYA
jgi:hypothetical protein